MTLILNLLSKDFVLQVSDRRLTDAASGRLGDDHRNKAVLWRSGNFHVSFAITGIADLDGEGADIWLARHLLNGAKNADENTLPTDILQQVAKAAGVAMVRIRRLYRKSYPLTIIGVGWTVITITGGEINGTGLVPVLIEITNAKDPSRLSDDFATFIRPLLPGRPPHLSHFGQNLTSIRINRIATQGHRVLRRQRGPFGVARIFQAHMRAIARVNSRVGTNMMVTCIPRKAAALMLSSDPSVHLEHGAPNLETSTYHYISNKQSQAFGPRFVFFDRYMGDSSVHAPRGINPLTGTIDLTEGSVVFCMALPDAPDLDSLG